LRREPPALETDEHPFYADVADNGRKRLAFDEQRGIDPAVAPNRDANCDSIFVLGLLLHAPILPDRRRRASA